MARIARLASPAFPILRRERGDRRDHAIFSDDDDELTCGLLARRRPEQDMAVRG